MKRNDHQSLLGGQSLVESKGWAESCMYSPVAAALDFVHLQASDNTEVSDGARQKGALPSTNLFETQSLNKLLAFTPLNFSGQGKRRRTAKVVVVTGNHVSERAGWVRSAAGLPCRSDRGRGMAVCQIHLARPSRPPWQRKSRAQRSKSGNRTIPGGIASLWTGRV